MADIAAQVLTIGATVVGASIAEVLRRGADRRNERRESRARLYDERRELYARVLTVIDERIGGIRRGQEEWDIWSNADVRPTVELVGSPEVVRLSNRLFDDLWDEMDSPVKRDRNPATARLTKQRAELHSAMRRDLGVD